jgi:hypothetical protein
MNLEERNLALDALERIAKHEKECGERWAEAAASNAAIVVELRELTKKTDNHATRWERLAWLIITTVLSVGVAVIVKTWS